MILAKFTIKINKLFKKVPDCSFFSKTCTKPAPSINDCVNIDKDTENFEFK